jgi:hypothetical protein
MSASGKMRSEQVVVSAPLSFAGSAQRIWKLTDQESEALKYGMMALAVCVLIPIAWMAVATWYTIFGILLVPYRMLRRGNRKDKVKALQHREQLEALTAMQQQQTLQTANLIQQNQNSQQSQPNS